MKKVRQDKVTVKRSTQTPLNIESKPLFKTILTWKRINKIRHITICNFSVQKPGCLNVGKSITNSIKNLYTWNQRPSIWNKKRHSLRKSIFEANIGTQARNKAK